MTDNEIVKALECCSYATYNSDCEKCPYYPDKECVKKQCTDIIDLINRQKAEIERLQTFSLQLNKIFMDFVNKEKTEARKEFAERLKGKICDDFGFVVASARDKDIDNLVKEMVCD